MKKKDFKYYIALAAGIAVSFAISYLLALVGEPQSEWLFFEVLGLNR